MTNEKKIDRAAKQWVKYMQLYDETKNPENLHYAQCKIKIFEKYGGCQKYGSVKNYIKAL